MYLPQNFDNLAAPTFPPIQPVIEDFWKLVKRELSQQLISYAEGFNVDLMHQGDQKVKQYTNATGVTGAIVTPKSEDAPIASPYTSLTLGHPFQKHIDEWLELLSLCSM